MEARSLVSIDLEAQVQAVAEAMRERDAEVGAAQRRHYYLENREFVLVSCKLYQIKNRKIIADQKSKYYHLNSKRIATYHKNYRINNYDLIAKQRRHFRSNNKEKIALQKKLSDFINRESISLRRKIYRFENKEAIAMRAKQYHLSRYEPKGVLRGEQLYNSKLTEDSVRTMRALSADGETQKVLAEMFHVTGATINSAVNRKTWRHVI